MTNDQQLVDDLPKFAHIDQASFKPTIEAALKDYEAIINQVKTHKSITWATCVQPLEEAAEKLEKTWSILEHLNSVVNTPEIRNIYENLLPTLTNFHTEILQDNQLFKMFVNLRDSDEYKKLSVPQQTIINNEIRDFNLAGVDLADAERNQYKGYVEALSELENTFSNNVLDATQGWDFHVAPADEDKLQGLPEHTIKYAKEHASKHKKKGWLLTLDYPCYHAIMSYAIDRELRELFYTKYNTRASDGKWDNTDVLAEILKLRHDIAQIIGYKTYAQFSLISKSAESVEHVQEFFDSLIAKVRPRARDEYTELTFYAQGAGLIGKIESWDITYYAERLKEERFAISEEELRDYFPEPRVLTGMFKLVRQLFGLVIEEITDFEKWDKAVRLFKITDNKDHLRGYFYIDLYTREGKQGGAWMSECLSRVRFANDYLQRPVAFLNCNFAPPTDGKPGLLSHYEVITLFHEFGHTLHHVLTRMDFFSVSGINGVAWDAVELPSQFMENWCWEWLVLQDITEHVNTGEPLPREMYKKLIDSKNFQSSMTLLRQLEYSIFDMRIHEEQNDTAHKILEQVRDEIAVVPVPDTNRFENSFTHIFGGGYAAGYYSYLWAEVLSCDAFDKFNANGLINPELGHSFLTNILEMGGSIPANDLFEAFAGRKPNPESLLKHYGIV